jgi:multiple sugar transport system permease protein
VTTATTPVVRTEGERRRAGSIAWHAGALLVLAVVLYPVIWVVGASFKPSKDIIASLDLLPTEPVWANFSGLADGISGISIGSFFWNSLVYAVLAVIGVVLSSSLTAYAFAKIRFAGRNLLFTLMIGTLLLPYHVLLIPQYVLFRNLELTDTLVPLVAGKFLATEAFFVFLMVQFMRGLPRELDEAAKLDGCGHLRTYWSIVMGPLIYLNTPEKYTVSLGLMMFRDQEGISNYGSMIAMSLVALVPVIAFFMAFQRYLIDGMATSGLKG